MRREALDRSNHSGARGISSGPCHGEIVSPNLEDKDQFMRSLINIRERDPLPDPGSISGLDVAKAREWSKLIDLPAGIKWRGKDQAPVSALIEGHHLECFIDREED